MPKNNLKEIFTCLGKMMLVDGRHRFVPNSTKYLHDNFARIPLNTELTCTFSQHEMTRSQQQLKYYWIILGYLATYNGDTPEEIHECIMIELFGTKKKKFNGKLYNIRQSISDKASFPKHKMVELISYATKICEDMDVLIPTSEELGYISNRVETKVDVAELHKGLELPKGKSAF